MDMDIKKLMEEMQEASSEKDREDIKNKIIKQFSSLTNSEKEAVRRTFTDLWDDKLKEAEVRLKEIDLAIDLAEVSKYISLSAVAKNYFGKSKGWLYQRIKGYNVNGKQAQFTDEERAKLAEALNDIGKKLNETSLRIA